MNLLNYIKNNGIIYGLTLINLNMQSDYIPEFKKFSMWAVSNDVLWFRFDKYSYDPYNAYLVCEVTIGHEHKMSCFYKGSAPSYDNVEIWKWIN